MTGTGAMAASSSKSVCGRLAVAVLSILAGGALVGCGGETPAATSAERPASPPKVDPPARDMGSGTRPARGSVAGNPSGWPPVEFEPAQMDFGVLSPGAAARGTTRIWNVGPEPLRIIRSVTSCGCTAAEDLAGRVIPPGGFTEFSTTMNMKTGLGEKREKITIIFEGYEAASAIHFFTAEVSLPVRVTPPHITASRRSGGGWVHSPSGQLGVESTDGRPFRILRAHGAPPQFVGYDPRTDPPRSRYTIRWDMTRFQGGAIPWFWVIETDRPDCPVLDVRIRHASTLAPRPQGRPWVPKDQRILVGIVQNGQPFEVTTKLEFVPSYPPDPTTAAVASESSFLGAELVEVQRDGQFLQYRVRLTPQAAPGLLYGKLSVFAAGFRTTLHIIGRVAE